MTLAPISLHDILPLIDGGKVDLIQHALDELVFTVAEADDSIDDSGVDTYEEVLDMRSLWAADLNNAGYGEQITYLLFQGAYEDVITTLLPIAQSGHAKAALLSMLQPA